MASLPATNRGGWWRSLVCSSNRKLLLLLGTFPANRLEPVLDGTSGHTAAKRVSRLHRAAGGRNSGVCRHAPSLHFSTTRYFWGKWLSPCSCWCRYAVSWFLAGRSFRNVQRPILDLWNAEGSAAVGQIHKTDSSRYVYIIHRPCCCGYGTRLLRAQEHKRYRQKAGCHV